MTELNEQTTGSRSVFTTVSELANAIDEPTEDVVSAIEYLEGEELVDQAGGRLTITHSGVVEVERALADPSSQTEYFPAARNVIHIANMQHSVIQQGTSDSHIYQAILPDEQRSTAVALVEETRSLLSQIMDADDRSEALGECDTISSQLRSSRPKRVVIREAFQRIRGIFTSVAVATEDAGALATAIDDISKVLGEL